MKQLVLVLALIFSTPVMAQDDETALRAAAEHYLNHPVQEKMMENMLSRDTITAQVKGMFRKGTIDSKTESEVVSIVSEEINTVRPMIEKVMLESVINVYSIEELEALTNFLDKPVGASAMVKSHLFMQQAMPNLAPIFQTMQSKIAQRIRTLLIHKKSIE